MSRAKKVKLELTALEAEQLFVGANVHAEEIRCSGSAAELGMTPAQVGAFWRAIEKLQQARLAVELDAIAHRKEAARA